MNRSDETPPSNTLAFLMGGGEMGRLIRSMDWSTTLLGPVAGWPQSLRTTLSICLASDLPICVIWGPGLVQLYNDAYRVICGDKHPRSMGQNFAECWKEAWPVIGEAHDAALTGDKAFLETQHIFLQRHGYREECFFTFSFSPIRNEAGQVGGLFHPVIEMTAQMLAQRRTWALRDLTAQTSKAKSVTEVLALSAQTLAEYAHDLPFVLTYAMQPEGDQARLVGATGLAADTVAGLGTVTLADLQAVGPHSVVPDAALVLPITLPGADRPAAILVAGISPCLPMNEAYRSFYDLLASALTAALVNASAYEDERRRASALAAIDRAKTAFFSNISHEFRTPLTLMLGPVEDALADADELPPSHRAQLQVVQRNGLRLQRLVNGLLEFSRIEAGRVRAAFVPTDLAEFTTDLASNFRSACEKAGLALHVDCPRLSEPVFVDRSMWEKIVFNLLSNAFKFTFEGGITVTLRLVGGAAELAVRDSGTGIAAHEMPRLFERFHRIENVWGRTHEGSGIGLALVQELVKLHGGTVTAQSKTVGEAVSEAACGSTFLVRVPLGTGHLPPEQVESGRTGAQPSAGDSLFVQEALRWLPDALQPPDSGAGGPTAPDHALGDAFALGPTDACRPRVLVADDNVDMRRYIQRLLSGPYEVEVVPDGEAALAAVRQRLPDLIVSDVMMPRLDGPGLLRALRSDPRSAGVPVILLSARAGEENRVEGMEAGADAYLVKPFSAKELLANVAALLKITRLRQEADEAIRTSEARYRALVSASSDVVYRMSADWSEMRHLQGREFIADTHEPSRSWLLKYIPADEQPRVTAAIDAAIQSKGVFELEHRVLRSDGTPGWTFSRAVPLLDGNGDIVEWFGAASDVTPGKQAEAALQQSEERFRTLFEAMDEGFCVIEMIFDADARPADYRFLQVNPAFEKHTGIANAQGRRIREIAPDLDAHWFEIYGQVAVTGESKRFVNEAKQLGGRWFDVYAFRLGGPGSHHVAVLFNDITSRKASEDALRASETRSKTILQSITDGFFALDVDWRITYINTAGERFLGRTPGDLIGKTLWDEFPGTVGSEFERVYRRVVAGRESESFTAYYPNYDRWYELTAYPAADGLSIYFRDVTEQHHSGALLRASEERRRLALDAAELGMWHVDPETRITQTDARFRAIFGTTEEWTDYLQAVALMHPDDQPAVLAAVAAATRLDDPVPYSIEYRIVQPDGSVRWVAAKGRSTTVGAGPTRRVVSFDGTVADITDRKRSEQERELLVAQLREQDQRKDEFLAILAHELRNPLAPIRNGLQVMRLAHGDPDATERVRAMMERQLARMVHLIDDLLDLSRISRGKLDLRQERIELAKAIQQAIETSRPSIEQADHELLIDVPPGPVWVDADLTRLAQVFSNLLNNAAKYTPRGGRIRLTVEHLEGEAVVSIKDDGIGIPTHMLSQVFEMFTQVDRTLERSHSGLGIGLAIVKRLVEMHGGSVEARSDGDGRGSEFTVRLPTVLSAAGGREEDGAAELPRSPPRRRILVVDDNHDAAVSLALMLTILGNETQTAHDGLEALEVAQAFRPDVVLLDIGLPKLNGYEVCRRIRQQAWGKGVVLFALTGWGQEEDQRRSLAAGFDAHLVKPVLPATLENLLAGVPASRA